MRNGFTMFQTYIVIYLVAQVGGNNRDAIIMSDHVGWIELWVYKTYLE